MSDTVVILPKGNACFQCRQNKVRCDGTKPICSRCNRLGKPCQFVPRATRARLPVPQEITKIRSLELQLKVHRMALASMHNLSLASVRLLERIGRLENRRLPKHEEAVWLPVYPRADDADFEARTGRSGQIVREDTAEGYTPVISRAVVEHEFHSYRLTEYEELPPTLSRYLYALSLLNVILLPTYRFPLCRIGLFLPYRSHYYFFMDVNYFLHCASLPQSHPDAIHPCLLNAIYLGACSSSGNALATLQPFFIKRTRHFLNQSLMYADRITHFLWASMVFACHLGRFHRMNEAYVVVSSAARLASACGLADSVNPDGKMENECLPNESLLPPPKNDDEAIDRIRLAYSIYISDQSCALLSASPRTFACDDRWLSLPGRSVLIHQDPENKITREEELRELWRSDTHLKASMMRIFERVHRFVNAVTTNGYRGHEEEYLFLREQISSHHQSIPPLSDPLGVKPLEAVGTFNPHILLAHATLYGAGLVLHSIRAGEDAQAHSRMVGCVKSLVVICEKVRAHKRLRRVQAGLMTIVRRFPPPARRCDRS
ncbi:hypothetical protein DL93DRAFT_1293104 [Clavulina sp. PMI_390]|nr:hypothetical protein DL93DRAFT_1293104 [Clavulina sp. PMI_390]